MVNGVGDRRGRRAGRAGVPTLATVLLAMLMAYSMMLIYWGVPWQFAVAIPVSLATAAVQLAHQMHARASRRRWSRHAGEGNPMAAARGRDPKTPASVR